MAGGDSFGDESFRVLSPKPATRNAASACSLGERPETRTGQLSLRLLTEDTAVKEIKLFNLGAALLKRYTTWFDKFFQEDKHSITQGRRRGFSPSDSLRHSGFRVLRWIVWHTVQGKISLGDMTLYLAIFRQGQSTFQSILSAVGNIYENSLFMANFFDFLGLEPRMKIASQQRKLSLPLRGGIEFRGVGFRYPGNDEWALRGVDPTIGSGEKVALVGHNGAGKTTLIKLLSRLYDPTEGSILIDGIDIRDLEPLELQQRIGVIFQDFVRYHLPVRENIGFGQIDAMDDPERIAAAARKSGADAVIEDLPAGYETMLGRWFSDGHELSLGQWQKIALARAFMREAEILVLDEPTASVDAQTEYEIFQHFKELTDGKMAILISHRFSTVRMADRIAVIQEGRITELGTHEELLRREGTYAKLFSMQAEGYK